MMGNTVPKNKYGAKVSRCAHGHTHPSRKEARRCGELHLLQRAGVISELTNQPEFWFSINGRQIKHPNGRRVGYKADFSYRENGAHVVEDTKSKATKTEAYALRIAIFRALFPEIAFRET